MSKEPESIQDWMDREFGKPKPLAAPVNLPPPNPPEPPVAPTPTVVEQPIAFQAIPPHGPGYMVAPEPPKHTTPIERVEPVKIGKHVPEIIARPQNRMFSVRLSEDQFSMVTNAIDQHWQTMGAGKTKGDALTDLFVNHVI